MKEISAGALVFYLENGKPLYLLLYKREAERKGIRYKEMYEFPKGNLEKGEKPEESTLREIKEETGLDVEILPNFKEKINWFYRREKKTIFKETIFFLAKAKTKDVKISREHDAYEWLSFEAAIEKLKFGNQKKILKRAHDFLLTELKKRKLKTLNNSFKP